MTLLGVNGSPPPPIICSEIYCLREGETELAVRDAWEGETSDCFTNTLSICLLNAAAFHFNFLVHSFFLADILTLFMKERKLENYIVYSYLGHQ